MTDPNLFKLTKDDKKHYRQLIRKIDIKKKDLIITVLWPKIESMLDQDQLNSVEVKLIKEINLLLEILDSNQNLNENIVKKILFAFTYFIDDNDDIPDIIPDLGYLDDIKVVEWVIEDIKSLIPEIGIS
tara:strand:- start:1185 stop:1571 length:387 start_codon:yes stop_codon:yes gene_type:complete